jgi:hypothetical protein
MSYSQDTASAYLKERSQSLLQSLLNDEPQYPFKKSFLEVKVGQNIARIFEEINSSDQRRDLKNALFES